MRRVVHPHCISPHSTPGPLGSFLQSITHLRDGSAVRLGQGLACCHALFHETRRDDFLRARIYSKAKQSRRFVDPGHLKNLCDIVGVQVTFLGPVCARDGVICLCRFGGLLEPESHLHIAASNLSDPYTTMMNFGIEISLLQPIAGKVRKL